MSALHILRAGPGATIQDGGRFLYRRYGVTPAGPMDWRAFRTANLALDNARDDAGIEIALGGVELTCEGSALPLAFCGGAFQWRRNGKPLPCAMRLTLQPGETLSARPGAWGAFAYLAVAGGLATPPVLGSRATQTRAHMGGLDGRMLQAGDVLPVAASSFAAQREAEIAAPWLPRDTAPFRVVLGPQQDYFTEDALATFFSAEFRLTHEADRMAYRFDAATIAHAHDFNIVSDGIALGAIQIAGDGKPLVLMADHQPTGGYPKLGHVARADLGRLAQLRPGETCRFAQIGVDEARNAWLQCEDAIAETQRFLRPLRREPTNGDLLQINLSSGIIDVDEP
ncbi:MAG: biotin-dependent carboxyltransferase family protein [Methylovirgula sp.]|jgi:biotin-dependent carboxylase-like uncharacterized protein